MAKTNEMFLQGKVKWAFCNKPDQFGDWSLVLYPNTESLNKINDLIKEGIKNKLKKDDDGYYIKFKRAVKKQARDGRWLSFNPPEVVKPDGTLFSELIGNGSDCTIKLETYGGKSPGGIGTYKAARLAGVRVDNLIPYKPAESSPDQFVQRAASGLEQQPPQVQGW